MGAFTCNTEPIEIEDESDKEKNLEFRQEDNVNFKSRNSQWRGKYRNTRPGNNLGTGKRQQKKQQTANKNPHYNNTAKHSEPEIKVMLAGDSQLRGPETT